MSVFGNFAAGYRAGRARRDRYNLAAPSSNNRGGARAHVNLNPPQEWILQQARERLPAEYRPQSNNQTSVGAWGTEYRPRSPAEYQPGPRLIRHRFYVPRARVETAHGTYYYEDYHGESEYGE